MVHNPSIPLKIKSIQRKTLKAKRFQGFLIEKGVLKQEAAGGRSVNYTLII